MKSIITRFLSSHVVKNPNIKILYFFMLLRPFYAMQRKVFSRLLILFISALIGIYLFWFALTKNLSIGSALILGIAPFVRMFIKVAYEVRRGELEIKKLEFLKHIGVNKAEQDYISHSEPK